MSSMDQAFIRAYRASQAERVKPSAISQVDTPAPLPRSQLVAGPEGLHWSRDEPAESGGGVATLTAAAAAINHGILRPAFEVERFIWPTAVLALGEVCSADVRGLVSSLITGAQAGRKVVWITAARRGAGATTLALALARDAAHQGARVALVDADFYAPRLADQLETAVELGWESVLTAGVPLAEVLIESTAEAVTLLPLSGKGTRAASGLGEAIAACLAELAAAYDLVLVDAGAGGGVVRGQPAGTVLADTALVVQDGRQGAATSMPDLSERLAAYGIGRIHRVVNFTEASLAG